jgi:2,3-bisphosphoglycerate-dependent phosphoglycerate mutase
MPQMCRLVLVRHAEATGQEAAAPLSVDGQRQALLLADVLQPFGIERVISSPFTRAVQSIAPFCSRTGVWLETDDRLIERVLSTRGVPGWRDHLRRSFDDFDQVLDGGESSRAAQRRALGVVREAVESRRRCALVTHGNLLTLILRSVDATVGFETWSRLSNPDAFMLSLDGAGSPGFTRIWR